MFDKKHLVEFVIQCDINQVPVSQSDKPDYKTGFRVNIRSITKLPDEVFTEILIRLPSKCLCRYKAVCRHWYNLISTNHLISRHVSHLRYLNGSHFVPGSFTFVFQDRFWGRSVSPEANHSLQVLPVHPHVVSCRFFNCLDFLPWTPVNADTPTHVEVSCRDLLLCRRNSEYYVVNSITDQVMALPSPPAVDHGQLPALYRKTRLGIICHDTDWCRFGVVLVSNPPEYGSSLFTIRVFSSESHQWRMHKEICYPWTPVADFHTGPMVPHGGVLYWVDGSALVSLDLFSTVPHTNLLISLPAADETAVSHPFHKLGVSQGRLRLSAIIYKTSIKVWELDEQDDLHSKGVSLLWRVVYKISYSTRMSIFAFHPYRSDAMFVQIGPCVYLLDLENSTYEKYVEMKLDKEYACVQATRSVVLRHPWFPTPLPSSYPILSHQ